MMTKIKLPKKSSQKSTKLDRPIYQKIAETYMAFRGKVRQIRQLEKDAFDRMFEFGELLLENESQIKEDYNTWGRFADEHGIDASSISRCKASVQHFKEHGADTITKARELLKERGFTPSAKLMENNINRLLTDGHKAGERKTPKDKSVRKERHVSELHQMMQRAEEIIGSHEPDDEIYQEAVHLSEYLDDSVKHLDRLDISQKQWNSKAYLNFCRNIRYDVVIGEPVDVTEPMHISPDGDMGSMGGKVADFYAIPGCRKTHNKLDNGELEPTKSEIAHWHRWTMVNFLFHTIKSDGFEEIEDADYKEIN